MGAAASDGGLCAVENRRVALGVAYGFKDTLDCWATQTTPAAGTAADFRGKILAVPENVRNGNCVIAFLRFPRLRMTVGMFASACFRIAYPETDALLTSWSVVQVHHGPPVFKHLRNFLSFLVIACARKRADFFGVLGQVTGR